MNEEYIFKNKPSLNFIKLDINGTPPLLDNTAELSSQFGESLIVVGCLLIWDFKAYDILNRNKILINSRLEHEHKFRKFSGLTLYEVEEVLTESHNDSRNLLRTELKKNGVQYLPSDLSKDFLSKTSHGLYAELKKLLY